MASKKVWYLKCAAEDCAPYVILVGDPARVRLFANKLTGAHVVARNREFTTLTGTHQGLPVSVISIGIGSPAAALAMEELWELGVRVVVRAGTVMALKASLGDFVLAQGAVRFEGTSTTYLPLEFPALADVDLLFTFQQVLDDSCVPYSAGLVATSDGFYTQLFYHGLAERIPSRDDMGLTKFLTKHGVIAADMETSAIYITGQYLGIKCISLCVATVDGHTQTMMNPSKRTAKESQLAKIVLNGLSAFAKNLEKAIKSEKTNEQK